MDLKNYFDSINLSIIREFVETKQEENIILEFKRAVHINAVDNNRNSDKKNLSKCISGFANSGGGIVVWGVEAKQKGGVDHATALKPISELKRFLNRLNTLEGQAVSPIAENIRHVAIYEEGEEDKGYVKTLIPESENAPHMANYSDKHYYKRSGDSFYIAEHFDIVDMLARNKGPKLELQIIYPYEVKRIRDERVLVKVTFAIVNKGRNIGKHPYLAMSLNFRDYKFALHGLDNNNARGLKLIRNNLSYQRNYFGGSDIVIYPNVVHQVDKIQGDFKLPIKEGKLPPLVIDYLITADNMKPVEDRKVIQIIENRVI